MRMIVFFDLPVQTKRQRRLATKFRNTLLKDGFDMLQFSVYSRIIRNDCNVEKHLNAIRGLLPEEGNVRVLTVTEKQYASMEFLVGAKTPQEKHITCEQLCLF